MLIIHFIFYEKILIFKNKRQLDLEVPELPEPVQEVIDSGINLIMEAISQVGQLQETIEGISG